MNQTEYPHVSLSGVEIDAVVARRFPRRLAYYYLALPLAQDGDALSVAMAHPEDPAASAALQELLGARVVPVRAEPDEIKAALNRLWQQVEPGVSRVLSWSASPERAAAVARFASALADTLWPGARGPDAGDGSLEALLARACEGQYRLVVMDAPQAQTLGRCLTEALIPLVWVRGECPEPRRILLLLRGHSPDDAALEWVIALGRAYGSLVTLLAVAPGLAALLRPDSAAGEHVRECARRLDQAGVRGLLKLRQGIPERQIAAEVSQGDYDLIAVAAEGHGDFVRRALREIERAAPDCRQPVLIVRPT